MYWFLVMHADYDVKRGEIDAVKGRKIGAAPWVELGLRRDVEGSQYRRSARSCGYRAGTKSGVESGAKSCARSNAKSAPSPHGVVNFGLNAAKALEARQIDGFWANGMGAEVAVSRGVGTVVLDVRRGDGPGSCFNYTMASLATIRSIDRR